MVPKSSKERWCHNYNIKNSILKKSIWSKPKTYSSTRLSNCRTVCIFIFGHFSIQGTLIRYTPYNNSTLDVLFNKPCLFDIRLNYSSGKKIMKCTPITTQFSIKNSSISSIFWEKFFIFLHYLSLDAIEGSCWLILGHVIRTVSRTAVQICFWGTSRWASSFCV